MTASVTALNFKEPLSIQGERAKQASEQLPLWMEMGEVDKYVDSASDEVIACRERGRHLWPSIRRAGIRFIDVTNEGLLVRRLLCECCQLAERVEFWEATGRGRNLRYEPVSSKIEYTTRDGERYLGPQGRGRMTPKMVRNSLASSALKGLSLTVVREQAKRLAKEA